MSAHQAVEALRTLGLSNYEAQVFVALQQLGTGTAQDVTRVSEVPRSQVYGAADDLADRGLIELVESSPKRFRPVSLETARQQLRTRLERQQERAFENLEAVQDDRADQHDERHVSTIRGRQPIRDRMVEVVADADHQVVFAGATDAIVHDDLEAALGERAEAGLTVMLVTGDQALAERFADSDVRVAVSEASGSGGYAGRTLLVDRATVVLSVPTAEDHPEPFEEVALWTVDTSIGRILARFVHAGMQAGLDEEYPATVDPTAD
jgi:sugar-specific transcriptional regulator TrmB